MSSYSNSFIVHFIFCNKCPMLLQFLGGGNVKKKKKIEWPPFVYISHKPNTCIFFPFVIFLSIECCIYIPILEMDLIPNHYQGSEFKCGGKKN